jgi:hypothetical protein
METSVFAILTGRALWCAPPARRGRTSPTHTHRRVTPPPSLIPRKHKHAAYPIFPSLFGCESSKISMHPNSGFVRRRALTAALLAAASTTPWRATAQLEDAKTTAAQRNLRALSDGTRRLSDEGLGEGDLVAELLRRTEANRDRNEAVVKRATEANAFTAIDGSVNRRIVTGLDGQNYYLDGIQVRTLTLQRRLACAPSVLEPCRMVEPSTDAPPLQLPAVRSLECDRVGRNCKFASSE